MNSKHIQHLYWRAGFGIGYNQLSDLQNKPKKEVVSQLFKEAKTFESIKVDLSEFNILKELSYKELVVKLGKKGIQELRKKSKSKIRELNTVWIDRLNNPKSVLHEKMTLFWANIFVVKSKNIWHNINYNNTLRVHALGDFGEFVKAIAHEPAMIDYLNNKQNKKGSPNENFARELMELFTLGAGNYSEMDIKESARAFTGWTYNKKSDRYRLDKKNHDYDIKTFFGKTGNFEGNDIIDIILEQKQCARYICTRIYKYFVNPAINKNHIEELTSLFYKDYNIEKLMHFIFNSDWFYEKQNQGVKIKSPMELVAGINQVVSVKLNKRKIYSYLQKMMGQTLLNPPNVAGWKGGKYWIDSNTLMFRLKLPSILLNDAVINLDEKGDIEASFEQYYTQVKNRKKHIKTTVDWEIFENEYKSISPQQLKELLISCTIDPNTESLLSNLVIENNKDFCIQLMSIPEYQLC